MHGSFYTFPYCTDLIDSKTGEVVFQDFECSVELEPEDDDCVGNKVFSVTGVYVDGFNLFNGDGLSVLIANRVAAKAEASIRNAGALWDAVSERLEIPRVAAE